MLQVASFEAELKAVIETAPIPYQRIVLPLAPFQRNLREFHVFGTRTRTPFSDLQGRRGNPAFARPLYANSSTALFDPAGRPCVTDTKTLEAGVGVEPTSTCFADRPQIGSVPRRGVTDGS